VGRPDHGSGRGGRAAMSKCTAGRTGGDTEPSFSPSTPGSVAGCAWPARTPSTGMEADGRDHRGPGSGAGPHVKVFRGTTPVLASRAPELLGLVTRASTAACTWPEVGRGDGERTLWWERGYRATPHVKAWFSWETRTGGRSRVSSPSPPRVVGRGVRVGTVGDVNGLDGRP